MVSALAVLLVFANVQISQAATSTNVDKFFAAVKSAKPIDIEAARKKYIAPNTSADIYAQMIVKHFTGTEYLKTLDRVGNVSPSAHDAPGKITKSKDGSFKLDSTFNTIDGTYKDFVLNKSKKISSFKVKTTNNSFVSIKDNIQLLTINYNNANNSSYNSDWSLSYLLIWDSHLSDIELQNISVSLNNFMKKGETLSFMNSQNQVIYSSKHTPQYPSQPSYQQSYQSPSQPSSQP